MDFKCWVMYGTWACCEHFGSWYFNDQYFKESVYQQQTKSCTPDLLSVSRRTLPDDPVEHSYGVVGLSSRWWYLPGMYAPTGHCGRCTKQPVRRYWGQSPGRVFTRLLQDRQAEYAAAAEGPKALKTGELYRVPRLGGPRSTWAKECVTWPRYDQGQFSLWATDGPSMLELDLVEQRALQVVSLKVSVREEVFGAAHQKNWKKVSLSRAYFPAERVTEAGMPTPRAAAAFRFMYKENLYYRAFVDQQHARLNSNAVLTLSLIHI